MLHQQPTMDLPAAKKTKTGEFIKGNNKYGSKGTVRCVKCQTRKGKCIYEDARNPCDYCFARGLECGPKLPTPRKQREQGLCYIGSNGVPYATIAAQGTLSDQFPGQIQVHIPITFSQHNNQPEFNLSSHCQDRDYVLASPTKGYKPYSTTAGFANLMPPVNLGITIPSSDRRLVQQCWGGQYSPSVASTSPEPSSTMYSPSDITRANSMEPPSPQPRHPAQTLAYGVLPFIRTAIPQVQPEETPREEVCPESSEQWSPEWEDWLQLEGPPSFNARLAWQKWNRVLKIPRSMMGRKLAGKWEDDAQARKSNIEEVEGRKSMHSVQTAPSIL